ncbi:MAG: ATP-grasp domain-containing protein [Armatimonadetes bacterium]|nr:ATP-grasp domain-containing protein [Armatimonadota bacterium]
MAISKILVANRGEIAVRVFRTARALGLKTVAVYSDADAHAIHRTLADEAVHIGDSTPSESYLNADKILDAARQTGADAIHPGYGFLSERAEFSEACAHAGIAFIGPPASAMRRLGAKIDAKQLAVENQVPITPGYFVPGATGDQLKQAAQEIGYPIMLKASAGGGGRGMRIVRNPADFDSEYAIAKDEALKGFGDDAMMVEKLVENPRHIEVQFIADQHGKVACLFERECSIQRRHQKLIEEAPSPFRKIKTLWPEMRDATKRLIRASGYYGAGTAEFMVDPQTGAFYFLEVNARLQVEHCVTEEITGLDLVALQIAVANGQPLGISPGLIEGDRQAIFGHSIETRIVAEDPGQGFLPSIGKIVGWAEPRSPGIRFDTGFGRGSEVSRFYDSMIAKVIAHGATREGARRRLITALNDFHVLGVKTNVAYLIDVLQSQGFTEGEIDTGYLGREFSEWRPAEVPPELGCLAQAAQSPAATGQPGKKTYSVWDLTDNWRNARA